MTRLTHTCLTSCMDQQVTLISTSEVAKAFGVGRPAVSRWVSQGKLKPALTTPGGHHKFDKAAIAALIEESTSGCAADSEQAKSA
ncbi:excise [Arthrobacter phage Popper]|uniref:Excise n=1 Tax=Arthrobacter phage Popper TaxID=2859633 RepID=A0AAE7WDU7_9CAUD|nr:excise [Arthrobacter phage Popper]QYC54959.1 excise [Arthrobacter phage Popper]